MSWVSIGWSSPKRSRIIAMVSAVADARLDRHHVGGVARHELQEQEIEHDDAEHRRRRHGSPSA